MKLSVLFFLMCGRRIKRNNSNGSSNILPTKLCDETVYSAGFDTTKLGDDVNVYKIRSHLENKKLLDILQDKNISIVAKAHMLEDNKVKPPNIFAGGLFKAFDFDIDTGL